MANPSNLGFEYICGDKKVFSTCEDIIIGLDIPEYIIGWHPSKLQNLNKVDAIIAGYIMWSIPKCSRIVVEKPLIHSIDIFNGDSKEEKLFGKILVELNRISGCSSPEAYEEQFSCLLASHRHEVKEFPLLNISTLYSKMASAATKDKYLKIIKYSDIDKLSGDTNISITENKLFNEVLFEYDLGLNFNGYPLEDESERFSKIATNFFEDNNLKRFHKNKNYKLKVVIEEYLSEKPKC